MSTEICCSFQVALLNESFENWRAGEKNGKLRENCVMFHTKINNGEWYDVSCLNKKYYICKRPIGTKAVDTVGLTGYMTTDIC